MQKRKQGQVKYLKSVLCGTKLSLFQTLQVLQHDHYQCAKINPLIVMHLNNRDFLPSAALLILLNHLHFSFSSLHNLSVCLWG